MLEFTINIEGYIDKKSFQSTVTKEIRMYGKYNQTCDEYSNFQ